MMNREKNFASAVVYIHNAQEWVGKFLETLIGVLEDNFEHAEIVCVNDCSEDGSVQAIRAASGKAVRTCAEYELFPRLGTGHERWDGFGNRRLCLRI